MSEELEGQAIGILAQMVEDVASVREFTIEQAPDIIQQLLLWKGVCSGTWAALFAVVALVYYMWLCRSIKLSPPSEDELPAAIFLALVGLIPAGLFLFNMLFLAKVLIAPKLFLIEYAAGLAR